MTRAQKGKHKKRLKSWHRGRGEARRFRKARLPSVGSGADPTEGAPRPIPRVPGKRLKGEAL